MSVANKVSIARILLVPAFVAALLYYHPTRPWLIGVALTLFLVGIASDAVDGFLARRQRQETELGAILDPIADKCLILSAIISCSIIRGLPAWMRLPAWFNVIVISRDVLLILGNLLLFAVRGNWNVRPSRLGKWATFSQMLVVPAALLGWPIKEPFILAASVLTVASTVAYVRTGLRLLG